MMFLLTKRGIRIMFSVFSKQRILHRGFNVLRITLEHWFPNCGTRTSSGTRRPSRWNM